MLASVASSIRMISGGKPIQLNFQQLSTFNLSEENSRVWFVELAQDSEFRKFERISDLIIRKSIEQGIHPKNCLKDKKFSLKELSYPEEGKPLITCSPHLTFMRLKNKKMTTKELVKIFGATRDWDKYLQDTQFETFNQVVQKFNQVCDGLGTSQAHYVDICIRWDFDKSGAYNTLERVYLNG